MPTGMVLQAGRCPPPSIQIKVLPIPNTPLLPLVPNYGAWDLTTCISIWDFGLDGTTLYTDRLFLPSTNYRPKYRPKYSLLTYN